VNEIPALRTPRLLLEPLVVAHADRLLPGFSDPALYKYIPTEPPRDVEALRARYQRLERRCSPDGRERWWNWAVRLASEATYVGLCEATVHEDMTASVAYFVFSAHMRQGYGAEQVGAMLRYLAEVGVRRAVARIDSKNVSSCRLVEALGFARTALVEGADRFKGRVSDELVYERALAG